MCEGEIVSISELRYFVTTFSISARRFGLSPTGLPNAASGSSNKSTFGKMCGFVVECKNTHTLEKY